jgi:hypothetical protein
LSDDGTKILYLHENSTDGQWGAIFYTTQWDNANGQWKIGTGEVFEVTRFLNAGVPTQFVLRHRIFDTFTMSGDGQKTVFRNPTEPTKIQVKTLDFSTKQATSLAEITGAASGAI